jgi:hypothetical protein
VIGVICLLPWLWAYTSLCLPISFTATPTQITYWFMNNSYRDEFALLNNVPSAPRFDALESG